MSSRFAYVTYIRTTPEKLWAALTRPEFNRQYWFGVTLALSVAPVVVIPVAVMPCTAGC